MTSPVPTHGRQPCPPLAVEVVHPQRRPGEAWHTSWTPPMALVLQPPPGDYRDQLPPLIQELHENYRPIVVNGSWTHGLLECWSPRMRIIKSTVHVPCWVSFIFPWRGGCFGRTCKECFWVGIHPTRWARATYGGALDNKYVRGVFHRSWRGVIGSLSGCYCCASAILDLGAIFAGTCGGSFGLNLMSWYSCATRMALRNRYDLPPTFGLPAGCDDCAVHLCCMYCASHQELRESAVRGIAGPGIHVLDVSAQSFKHVPGIEQQLAQRQAEMDASLESIARVPSRQQAATLGATRPQQQFMQRMP